MRRLGLLWFLGGLAGIAHGLTAAVQAPDASGHIWKPLFQWMPDTRTTHPASVESLECSELRLRSGDDPRWANPAWDDQDWPVIGYRDVPTHSGINWLRFRVRLPKDGPIFPPQLMISMVAAMDVFWDGEKVGSCGVPGHSAASERASTPGGSFVLPSVKRAQGEHVVAVRFSNHRFRVLAQQTGIGVLIVDPLIFQAEHSKTLLPLWVTCSGLGLLAIVSASMWLLAGRRQGLLLLAGIFFCDVLFAGTSLYDIEIGLPYDWGYFFGNFKLMCLAASAVLTVAFVAQCFAVPYARWGIAAVSLAFLAVLLLSQDNFRFLPLKFNLTACVAVLACAFYGVWRKERVAWLILLGSGVAIGLQVTNPIASVRPSFFFRLSPLYLALIGSVVLDVGAERRKARAAHLAAARLEIQLLKKNLHPHFLFNTLAALAEVVESDPQLAVKLIHHLADEFRVLVRVSQEKDISLGEELELCRTHLAIMSVRTDTPWTLAAKNVNHHDRIPPALFLTLIENSFAHQRPPAGRAEFVLCRESLAGILRYIFFSPGAVRHRPAAESSGTGLRYVKARLDESFPGTWELFQREVPGGWQTTISWRLRPAPDHLP